MKKSRFGLSGSAQLLYNKSLDSPFLNLRQPLRGNSSYIFGRHSVILVCDASVRNSPSVSFRKRDMKFIAAYLLAVLGGKASPSAGDIKKILSSVGAEADDSKLELLLSQVEGKDITELIAAGREKLASVPSGGGAGAVAAVAAAPSSGGGAAPAAEEKKKEEKVEDESEEDIGFDLFGGDD